MSDNTYAIVADIGGTHARFSRANLDNLTLDHTEVFQCAQFNGLAEAIRFYQQSKQFDIKHAGVAIACPVLTDHIVMTNGCWQFSIHELKHSLALYEFEVLNDFSAAAMSLPYLHDHEKIRIGGGLADPTKPMLALGAGTGLGAAHLIPYANGYIPLAGEGGHVDWAPQTSQEWHIHRFLSKQWSHVSVERLLSGPGLENIYRALADYQSMEVEPQTAASITQLALTQSCPLAMATVDQFFASLGSVAGNLALTLSTFGGVYILGGVVPKLLPLIHTSPFRERFEAKGRFSAFNQQIATYIVSAAQPGLLGAAVYLKQLMM